MGRSDLSTLRTIAWSTGLLMLCVAWGSLTHVAMSGTLGRPSLDLGAGIGMGVPVYLITSLGAAVAYGLTRNRVRALWTWTILVLAGFAVLGVGSARMLRASATEEAKLRTSASPDPSLAFEQTRKPIATITIDELLREFDENEFVAGDRYASERTGLGVEGNPYDRILNGMCVSQPSVQRCRFVEISAEVRSLGSTSSGAAYLILASSRPGEEVSAEFSDPDDPSLRALRRGQHVRVVCLVHFSRGARHVTLTECSVARR